MTLEKGSRIGPYEVLAPLGAGGMGEVWRATDTRLGRDVALKLLPVAFASDPDRLARLEREAKLLASLSHTHIAGLFALEEATLDGAATPLRFLAMELAEGEDLAERLKRGAIPVDEAIAIAKQIAEALEAAHEKGIVHRDLKPANVKVSAEGHVKVLDFGLAKAWSGDGDGAMDSADGSLSPTLARTGTAAGLILGTAAYMSPEQARGKPVDKRADIWAFGVLLYEMLSGRRLFSGDTVSDVLAAVLRQEIDWKALPASAPAELRRLLARCLERDPKNRLHDIADARIVLDERLAGEREPALGPSANAPPLPNSSIVWRGLPWLIAAALLAVVAWLATRDGEPAVPSVVATLPPPSGTSYYLVGRAPGPAVLTRNGSHLAFAAIDADSVVRLFVRDLATGDQRPMPGTEGAEYPFWSPDGRWIGYFSQREASLRKIRVDGGTPLTVCRAVTGKGGSWSEAGVILFTPNTGTPIHSVSADGGESTPITEIDGARFNSHRHPRFLPGGRRFLFFARAAVAAQGAVMVASLDGGAPRELVASTAQAEYASGHLLFLREGTLMAQRFDPAELAVAGSPTPVVADVPETPGGASVAPFSVSETGLLVVHRGTLRLPVQMELRDRSGRLIDRLGAPAEQFSDMTFAPDGRRVAYTRVDKQRDVYILDLIRRAETRFTTATAENIEPVWTPDGRSVIFASNRSGPHTLYRKALGGAGQEDRLLDAPVSAFPAAVSPDGGTLFYLRAAKGGWELWRLDLASGRTERAFDRDLLSRDVAFSPDGRWMLFGAVEGGQREVFATPYPGPGRTLQVSRGGGEAPYWRVDGREILYVDPAGTVMAVPVVTTGETLELGAPKALFRAPPPTGEATNVGVSPDGQRFLVSPEGAFGAPNELQLIVNWPSRLVGR